MSHSILGKSRVIGNRRLGQVEVHAYIAFQKDLMLLKKSSGPDLFRPGEKTTRLEALYTIADDHLGI